MQPTSETLKTCIEINNSVGTWNGEAWYDLYLCGRLVGTIVGKGRALSQLFGIAHTQDIDIYAARAAYLEALEAEAAAVEAIKTQPVEMEAPAPMRIIRETHPALRRCFEAFASTGLPTDAEGLRYAAGLLLGLPAASRARLSVAQWDLAALLASMGQRPRLAS